MGKFGNACVIIPVYNESATVEKTVIELREHFEYVVCVDDGSTDGSGEIALAAGAIVLRHIINQGQGAALQTGFDYAQTATDAEYVVTFDADGQHLVKDAARMLFRAREERLDVVLASRFTGATVELPVLRGLILRIATAFTRVTTGLDVTDTHNGLRVLNRTALTRIRLELPRMAYASELLNAIVPNGLSYAEEPITVVYTEYSRAKGQRNSNALNILFDLAMRRLRSAA
jgi:glycosyltransferase involved in cell wall biosynthesis